MKILQIIPVFDMGGAETMCENLCVALHRKGHQVIAVSLYTKTTPITRRLDAAGVPIVYLNKRLGFDPAVIMRLIRLFGKEKPEVVHTHTYASRYALPAAVLCGVRKRVHTIHSVAQREASAVGKLVNGMLFRGFRVVPVALSREIQATVQEVYKLTSDRIPVVFNGVDLTSCIPREDYAQHGETFTVLHIGRFAPVKNHELLLRTFAAAASRCPALRLRLIGDGELLAPMQALAAELGVEDRVEFLGQQSNVYPYLHEADCFVLPSRYEGLPMTLIEAMGMGLPIAASRVGGIPDMITDQVDGLLVEPAEEAWLRAVNALYHDTMLRKRLGRNARTRATFFSAEKMAQGYLSIYHR